VQEGKLTYQLRHLNTKTDLPLLADWFTLLEDQVNTPAGLAKYYEQNKELIHCRVVENSEGEILGFSWAKLDQFQPSKAYMVLYVLPDHRNKGIGSSLFDELDQFLVDKGCREFKSNVPEGSNAGLAFMTPVSYTHLTLPTN
jgi:GNAT superfamily N-acetyltransferase